MALVKILGLIDLIASITFLSMIFSINIPGQLTIFLGGLLFIKGLFVLTGDLFSLTDTAASIIFFLSIFFTPWNFILWIFSLFLMSKGAASFL